MAYEYFEERLTGRACCRTGWFGRQILVVEVAEDYYSASPARPGTGVSREQWQKQMYLRTVTSWRDATGADLRCVQVTATAAPVWANPIPNGAPPY